MFNELDSKMFTVKKIINITSIIFTVLSVIFGIVLLFQENYYGLFLLILLPFLVWLVWVIAQLKLTVICDLKLIRNKLYEQDNSNLVSFGVDLDGQNKISMIEEKNIEKFKKLLEQNIITQEEYDSLIKHKNNEKN